jgi:23S rRNA pseudouridine1911/1915/1917 synthase
VPAKPLDVLFEDNHCIVVAKQAGDLMVGDSTGDETLLDRTKQYIRDRYQKPGNVFLGVVHRLDRPVSGVALYARTSKAASRLAEQFRVGSIEKTYLAWVTGRPTVHEGTLTDWLLKDSETNTVRVVSEKTPGAKHAVLDYSVVESLGWRSLLEIHPQTGRSHQIRVQLASRGWSILGDGKYDGPKSNRPGAIALHAHALKFQHPTKGEMIKVTLDPPNEWSDWFDVPELDA